MYTINQGSKILHINHCEKQYHIGFRDFNHAIKVISNINHKPNMRLVTCDKKMVLHKDINTIVMMDSKAKLYIKKLSNHVCDDQLYLHKQEEDDFLEKSKNGIVIPYNLENEDEHEFKYTCHVIEWGRFESI